MAWTYDPAADILTVSYVTDATEVEQSVALDDAVVDLDRHGRPIRVVIRPGTKFCPHEALLDIYREPRQTERLYTIREVAKELGLRAYTIRQEILTGGMPIVKARALWLV